MTTINTTEFLKSDSEFHAEIKDLINLGWELEKDDSDKYHIVIRYYASTDKFTMQIVNSEKFANKIWEGGDEENAGDSDMIKADLIALNEAGQLFNVDLEKDWL